MLSDILVLNNKVLTYGTSTTRYSRIFITNNFKILILVYLYKGNTSIISIDNSFIKLKVVIRGKTLAFLS